MQRTFMSLAATLAVVLLPAARAAAEEIQFASHAEIMSVLERQNTRIAELEAALGGGGCGNCCTSCDNGCCNGCGDSCCNSCCDSCCDACCGSCECPPAFNVLFSAEFLLLKPHTSGGIRGALGGIATTDFDFGYEPSVRFAVGVQGGDGLGFRLRYWEFDQREELPLVITTQIAEYSTYTLDAEFIDTLSVGNWDVDLFAGFRFNEYEQIRLLRLNAAPAVQLGTEVQNSSYGMTLGTEVRRGIGNGLSMFVNGRTSVLMGDEHNNFLLAGLVFANDQLDNVYYIWESQVGAQYGRETEFGNLFARAAFEVQVWQNYGGDLIPFAGLGGAGTGAEDWGLGGVAFSAGINR